ncbi:nose resistant to fluoxetine protein 6-like [Chrysoperla carnea]|uniref:nose resistant to fluoxetine protein 6-like n=1 Tax=Chrysoperla carnea TaxID=189513 RepID=UPI001D07E403|nr:nose resistant to fluoxetine protein 6-like [Chrysoperla carnea]
MDTNLGAIVDTNETDESLLALFQQRTIEYDLVRYEKALNALEDGTCKEHLQFYIERLSEGTDWALKMYDSSAKEIDGYLSGSRYEFGNFDECIATEYRPSFTQDQHPLFIGDLSEPLFKGQYCLADITHKSIQSLPQSITTKRSYKERARQNTTIHWGICIPSSCSYQDVEKFVATMLDIKDRFNVSLNENLCYVDKKINPTTLDITYACIILGFLLITTLATVFHVCCLESSKNDKIDNLSILEEVIVSFSVMNNLRKIFTCKQTNPHNLNFIGGIRTIAMLLVISGHSLLFTMFGPITNQDFRSVALKQYRYVIFSNSLVLVETFLLMSGVLMAFMLLIELDKRNGRINFIFIYIGRYIRLTPAFIIVIGFYCTWMIYMGDGPLWTMRMSLERERCLQSWWADILYINNYVNTDYLCMFQSWYLAVDTQLFIIAPFIIYPLWKWKQFGRILLGISIVVTLLIPFIIQYVQDYDPTLMEFASEHPDLQYNYYFMTAYIKTHMRASSYFLGLLLGYLLYVLQKSKFSFNKYMVISGWTVAILAGVSSLCSITYLYETEDRIHPLAGAFYNVGHKILWNIGIGWIIVACITKNGGLCYKIISWSIFQPLGKLTYCAYLVNGLVIIYGSAVTREQIPLNVYEAACRCIAHVMVSFIGALILCVLFESPIHGVERILLRSGRRKESSNTTTETKVGDA